MRTRIMAGVVPGLSNVHGLLGFEIQAPFHPPGGNG
jgi:hypothetical protein